MKRFFTIITCNLYVLIIASLLFANPETGGEKGFSPSEASGKKQQQRHRHQRGQSDPETDRLVSLTPEEKRFLKISCMAVQQKVINDNVEANGVFTALPDKVAKVGPVISGRVSELLVGLGDWVDAGQPLAKLVSVDIGQAVSDYYKSVAELELAKINYERYERLIQQNIGARKDLLTAEADFKIAQTNLNAAEKTLHAFGFTEEDLEEIKSAHVINAELLLRAPISGRIVERNVTVGERVGEDSTLFTIMDLHRLFADAQIYERDICKLRIGQKTEITVNALPGRIFTGEVIYIGQRIDPETRTLAVRTAIENPKEELKEGMFARVKIFTGSNGMVLCVPIGAVLEDRGQSFVFVSNGDAFRLVDVSTGSRDDAWVQIEGGIVEGDQVVVSGNYGLYSKFKQAGAKATQVR